MIHEGTDLKFKVKILLDGFSLQSDDYSIAVKNRWGLLKYFIPKGEFFHDEAGGTYFTIENVQDGTYYAVFAAQVPDDDYDKLTRTVTDRQLLCRVGHCDCGTDVPYRAECLCEHHVSYEQVWDVKVDGGTYLADKDGNLILTADGKRIELKKAGTGL